MDLTRIFDLQGRTALVTGGSRGIGAMIAEGLLSAGMTVHICARKTDELDATAARLSKLGVIHAIQADLSTPAGIATVAAAMAASTPTIDLLVNNAGITHAAPIADFPRKAFDKVLAVNLGAVFDLTRALLPQLKAAASREVPARVINIASVEGLRPPDWDSFPYSASKAGLIMLTRHLAKRLAADQITVNAIAAGLFKSRMTGFLFDGDATSADLPIPLGRAGCPEEMAATVIYLASAAGAYLTGATIPLSGGVACAD
jgi:NAD(P)-dependent dehydrogenase (short-subunit alcohol dehydrogenase family)